MGSHSSHADIVEMQQLKLAGYKVREIAGKVRKSPATVSRHTRGIQPDPKYSEANYPSRSQGNLSPPTFVKQVSDTVSDSLMPSRYSIDVTPRSQKVVRLSVRSTRHKSQPIQIDLTVNVNSSVKEHPSTAPEEPEDPFKALARGMKEFYAEDAYKRGREWGHQILYGY